MSNLRPRPNWRSSLHAQPVHLVQSQSTSYAAQRRSRDYHILQQVLTELANIGNDADQATLWTPKSSGKGTWQRHEPIGKCLPRTRIEPSVVCSRIRSHRVRHGFRRVFGKKNEHKRRSSTPRCSLRVQNGRRNQTKSGERNTTKTHHRRQPRTRPDQERLPKLRIPRCRDSLHTNRYAASYPWKPPNNVQVLRRSYVHELCK